MLYLCEFALKKNFFCAEFRSVIFIRNMVTLIFKNIKQVEKSSEPKNLLHIDWDVLFVHRFALKERFSVKKKVLKIQFKFIFIRKLVLKD